jgi:5-formyltetrahydrofolate cyclo-ligase
MTLEPDKASLRVWARRRRAELPEASSQVCTQLEKFILKIGARTVLSYRAFRDEPNLDALVARLPDVTFLTTRANADSVLSLHPFETATQANRHGILEPHADAAQFEPEIVELALVPGLLFTKTGDRLGYGGGFYDRLLPELRCPLVGVTRDALIVESLPLEVWDVRMDWLCTESGIQSCESFSVND